MAEEKSNIIELKKPIATVEQEYYAAINAYMNICSAIQLASIGVEHYATEHPENRQMALGAYLASKYLNKLMENKILEIAAQRELLDKPYLDPSNGYEFFTILSMEESIPLAKLVAEELADDPVFQQCKAESDTPAPAASGKNLDDIINDAVERLKADKDNKDD